MINAHIADTLTALKERMAIRLCPPICRPEVVFVFIEESRLTGTEWKPIMVGEAGTSGSTLEAITWSQLCRTYVPRNIGESAYLLALCQDLHSRFSPLFDAPMLRALQRGIGQQAIRASARSLVAYSHRGLSILIFHYQETSPSNYHGTSRVLVNTVSWLSVAVVDLV